MYDSKRLRSEFEKADNSIIFCAQALMVIAEKLEEILEQKTKVKDPVVKSKEYYQAELILKIWAGLRFMERGVCDVGETQEQTEKLLKEYKGKI